MYSPFLILLTSLPSTTKSVASYVGGDITIYYFAR